MTPQSQLATAQALSELTVDEAERQERGKAVRKLKNYVNGQWVDPKDGRYIDIENPSTGEVIAQSPLSSTEETNQAIAAAKEAWPEWAATPVARRCEMLFALA